MDVSVQVSLDGQEAIPDSNCFNAEVFYGDTRISPNALSVSAERSAGAEIRVRIRSSVIVDEPVVTVFLRASCTAAISRRYVLLAEALPENEAPQPAIMLPPAAPVPPAAPSAAPGQRAAASGSASTVDKSGASSSQAQRRAERAEQRRAQREARKNQAKEKPASKGAPFKTAEPKKSSTPRLKVDLLDLSSLEPSLRGSYELLSVPSNDQAVRSQAQALWRALNASPEESQRELQRLDALEIQARASLEQNKRLEKDNAKLAVDLKTAQGERYVNPLTIGLGIFSLFAFAVAAWAWRRNQVRGNEAGQPWWGSKQAKASEPDEQQLWAHLGDNPDSKIQPLPSKAMPFDPEDATYPGVAATIQRSEPTPKPNRSYLPEQTQPIPVTISEPSAAYQASPLSKPPSRSKSAQAAPSSRGRSGFGNTDFAASNFGNPRVVAAEELFDIQEQADFFLSLDQPDQAIEVLKNHITEHVETSALAYMDLFDIYYRTKREADYAELREEFNHVFNAQVPVFAKYGAPSRGLEDAPEVLRSIQAAWSRPQQAQDVIEASIFRQPGQDHKPMDMLAYRELMLLYTLAKELGRPSAKYSMLPTSMQTSAISSFAGLPPSSDFGLGEDFSFSNSEMGLPSVDISTGDLPSPSTAATADEASSKPEPNNEGVDFDLSDSELGSFKLLKTDKNS
ncbi:MAG: hypothetical protein EAZ37_10730 [Burkholderiales bacterium]|nr:MAG: hypothetical protein EAZ37_10730 [Burkholderiales bacterium]